MRLALRDGAVDVAAGAPLVMGIVNATPDSFSDRQGPKDVDELAARAFALAEQGAHIIDVGGESGRTDTEAVSEDEEAARIVPLVRRLARGRAGGVGGHVARRARGGGAGGGRGHAQRRLRPGRARAGGPVRATRAPRS